ncbi:MAG: acetylornithine transaminase [Chloroflexota bacterium]
MNAETIIQNEADYVLKTYGRPDVVFTHGDGAYLFDTDGNKYLDFTSGIAVTVLGHNDPDWVTAVTQQASRLTHVSNLYHTEPQATLAKNLVEHSFADKVYFCNSGAEANEAALKFARKHGKSIKEDGSKSEIISFTGSFHGRTMGVLAATYKEQYRAPFEPLMPGVTFLPFNDIDAFQAAINENTCAVIIEPLQGEGGINPATAEFLQALRAGCDQHDALLIFDEVQCGLGRTGTLWGHESYNISPDVMSLAKPLAGGLPIGATLVTQKVADVMKPGDHGSTFAAGPLVCAAANAVFNKVNQPEFLTAVQQNGAYLKHRLETLESELINEVRGAGFMVGVQMKTAVSQLVTNSRDDGLLILNAGPNVLRMLPPLIAGRDHIDEAISILEPKLDKLEASLAE